MQLLESVESLYIHVQYITYIMRVRGYSFSYNLLKLYMKCSPWNKGPEATQYHRGKRVRGGYYYSFARIVREKYFVVRGGKEVHKYFAVNGRCPPTSIHNTISRC